MQWLAAIRYCHSCALVEVVSREDWADMMARAQDEGHDLADLPPKNTKNIDYPQHIRDLGHYLMCKPGAKLYDYENGLKSYLKYELGSSS